MMTSAYLTLNGIYTRKQLREQFRIIDANINNGVFHPKDHESVWLFVTEHKSKDRTQYSDYLDNNILHWDGQTQGRTNPLIINHMQKGLELLVFYRRERYEHPGGGFKYAGVFEYLSHEGQYPSHFVLRRINTLEKIVENDLRSQLAEEEYLEGGQRQRFTNYYERDAKLRTQAILFHGTKCMVCDFDFQAVYGERGMGYIEVHHLKPVSTMSKKTKVNPKTDMAVVCANCHRMIHRENDNVLSLNELRALLQR